MNKAASNGQNFIYVKKKARHTVRKNTVFVLGAVLCALILAIFGSLRTEISEDMEIYDKTLRLHIPANSDSAEDQALKLKVRDAVIDLLKAPLSKCGTKEDAEAVALRLVPAIKKTAEQVISENGKNYKATVTLTEEYYPKKEYDGITLPAGNYSSLKIELGEADGQNWWCVLFPQVCTGTAKPKETLAEVGFTSNQIRLLTEQESGEYTVKFKIVEIIERLFG